MASRLSSSKGAASVPPELVKNLRSEKKPAKSQFQFIHSTPNAQGRLIGASNTAVKKHVMRDIGRTRRRKPRSDRPQAEVDFLDGQPLPTQDATMMLVRGRRVSQLILSPVSYLGAAAHFDPFNAYPIPMDRQAFKLVDHIWNDHNVGHHPFREFWFRLGMIDPGAMHQILANAALHLSFMEDGANDDNDASLRYNSWAVESVRRRIDNSKEALTDGIMSAILGLMCYDQILGRSAHYEWHFEAFRKILNFRGGISSIETDQTMRMSLYWIEHNRACSDDSIPFFQPPFQFLPPMGNLALDDTVPHVQLMQEESIIWISTTQWPDIDSIMHDLDIATLALSKETSYSRVWRDSNYLGMWIYPIIYKLLVLQHQTAGNRMLEFLRLGCILYTTQLRRKFGVIPVRSETHVGKLKRIVEAEISIRTWENGSRILKIWALVMAGLGIGDLLEKSWIWEAWSKMHINPDEILPAVRRMWWLALFDGACAELETQYKESAYSVTRIATSSPHQS